MIRAAVLASGDGGRLQAILDAMYFKEIPNFELVAVICPQRECNAMKRALNAGVPAYVVDPELFPTMTSHSIAVSNKVFICSACNRHKCVQHMWHEYCKI